MAIRVDDSFVTDLEELYHNVVDLDIVEQMEEDGEVLDDLDDLFKLQKSGRYIDIMQKVVERDLVEKKGKGVVPEDVDDVPECKFIVACNALLVDIDDVPECKFIVACNALLVDIDDVPECKFIVACNALLVDIDNEIIIIHNFIRDNYKLKFPELESTVTHPIDYARVVKKIGNKVDVNFVDLEGLLPSAIIEVVSVLASTTIGKPLQEHVSHKTVKACNTVLALDSAKKKVVHFVENRMGYIAPNLSVVVGSVVAVKLMGAAGGLSSLANMPCCDIELLGADLKNLPRFPSPDIYDVRPLGAGYINQSGMFKSAPPNFRIQTYQLLAKKCKLAAHMDSTRGDPTGEYGRSLREEILQMIENWQKPRPVPVPTETVPCKRRRGGRVPPIKKKQTYDIMKLVNNMIFGVPEKPKEGYGMLGRFGSSGADTMSSLAFTSELSNSAKQLAGSGIQST